MSLADDLAQALGATAAALDAGDPVAAAAAMDRASAARRELEASGRSLSPGERERAQALFADCQRAAGRFQASLGLALERVGRSQRARSAYRR